MIQPLTQYPTVYRERRWGPGESLQCHVPQISRSLSGWYQRRGRDSGHRCWHLQGREGKAGDGRRGSAEGSEVI